MSDKKDDKDLEKISEAAESIEEACSLGILERLADEYILFCCAAEDEEKEEANEEPTRKRQKQTKKERADGARTKFPNVAGFCRYFGIGRRRYEQLSKKYPYEFEKLSAVFEDEALNSHISPSLLSAYLKRRLGYDDSSAEDTQTVDTGQLRLVFDHDIFKDGE